MAVVLTPAQVASAVRLGDAAEEQAQAARLLGVATAAIVRHLGDAYNTTPQVVVNEAAIRIVGYLFDAPQAAQGAGYADILRNSAALALLAPYRVHRAGTTRGAEAVAGGTPDDGGVTPTPGGGVDTAAVLALIADWAETNNAEPDTGRETPRADHHGPRGGGRWHQRNRGHGLRLYVARMESQPSSAHGASHRADLGARRFDRPATGAGRNGRGGWASLVR